MRLLPAVACSFVFLPTVAFAATSPIVQSVLRKTVLVAPVTVAGDAASAAEVFADDQSYTDSPYIFVEVVDETGKHVVFECRGAISKIDWQVDVYEPPAKP